MRPTRPAALEYLIKQQLQTFVPVAAARRARGEDVFLVFLKKWPKVDNSSVEMGGLADRQKTKWLISLKRSSSALGDEVIIIIGCISVSIIRKSPGEQLLHTALRCVGGRGGRGSHPLRSSRARQNISPQSPPSLSGIV